MHAARPMYRAAPARRRPDAGVRSPARPADMAVHSRVDSRGFAPRHAACPLHSSPRMSPRINVALPFVIATATVFAVAACSSSDTVDEPPVDAALRPVESAGRYELTSTFSLASPPPAAARVLDELLAATDGPDDPSRYLIDLMIERLPEGRTRTYAAALAPYLAAYINERVADVAPRFAPGARALSVGLSRVAHRFGTTEELVIDSSGDVVGTAADIQSSAQRRSAWRTIVGLRFDIDAGAGAGTGTGTASEANGVIDVRFASLGLPDTAAMTQIAYRDGALSLTRHDITLPYTALLRIGFDFAVIPSVVPGTHDLAHALAALVDCDHLGALVSDWVGLGSPGFYATGCTVGLTSLAARIYTRIDAIAPTSVALDLEGLSRATDTNADERLDTLATGAWTGSIAELPVSGSFEGERR
jgi:hypothetical protein